MSKFSDFCEIEMGYYDDLFCSEQYDQLKPEKKEKLIEYYAMLHDVYIYCDTRKEALEYLERKNQYILDFMKAIKEAVM